MVIPMRLEWWIILTGEDNDEERVRSYDAWRNAEGRILVEYGLSQNQLAKAIGISPNRITEIVNNRRRITADTALRLSLYFGNSPEFRMNLQSHYDVKMARNDRKAVKS
jgi:addiction module HigA family antidote